MVYSSGGSFEISDGDSNNVGDNSGNIGSNKVKLVLVSLSDLYSLFNSISVGTSRLFSCST